MNGSKFQVDMKWIAFFVMTIGAATVLGQEKQIKNVSTSEFKEVMDSMHDEVVIDLRTPEEVKQGKIPGAVVIDFFGADFEPALSRLDKNKVYLLYCAGGGRSGETTELMEKMGFKRIYNLEGGFKDWVKKRLPVELK